MKTLALGLTVVLVALLVLTGCTSPTDSIKTDRQASWNALTPEAQLAIDRAGLRFLECMETAEKDMDKILACGKAKDHDQVFFEEVRQLVAQGRWKRQPGDGTSLLRAYYRVLAQNRVEGAR